MEEYERSQEEEWRQTDVRHEQYTKDQCAATGKTRQEIEADLFRDSPKCAVDLLPPLAPVIAKVGYSLLPWL